MKILNFKKYSLDKLWLIPSVLAISWLWSQQTQASTILASNDQFEIVTDSSSPAETSDDAYSQARGLLGLLQKRLIPSLPTEAAKTLSAYRIRIVFAHSDSSADGLFLTEDPTSPDGSTLLIQIKSELMGSADLEALVTHEFFHAVHYKIHPDEQPWIREGLAQMFELMVLKNFNAGNVEAAFARPETPLMGRYDLKKIVREQYGHDLFYFYYLWQQCGGDSVLWSIAQGAPQRFGPEGITAALGSALPEPYSKKPQCLDFASSALSFEIARIHNHRVPGTADPNRYALWSTTLPAAKPREKLPNPPLSPEPWTPVTLRFDLKPPKELGSERWWLHREYPYEVQREAPAKADASWWQLLLKTS